MASRSLELADMSVFETRERAGRGGGATKSAGRSRRRVVVAEQRTQPKLALSLCLSLSAVDPGQPTRWTGSRPKSIRSRNRLLYVGSGCSPRPASLASSLTRSPHTEPTGHARQEITLYDVKSVYNKAKAYALNLTEYETKVHEATNDEPWGASSTLMQDIAQATFNFQLFNEIMPCIYARFTDKEARQWRQIYKALVLLEYLVKNGSERVVDDARSNSTVIRVLRNFHYIDENGKDQGINVRNRAKEIGELLSDLDRVRQERRKAKANRAKYTGVSSDGFRNGAGGASSSGGFSSSSGGSGSRYGGFGSDSFYAGNGAGGGGGTSSSGAGAFPGSLG